MANGLTTPAAQEAMERADALPEPLTPPDCDLRDFQFMPVDIVRLFNSRFHAVVNDAEWRAGVTLWLKSFHVVPAGSIPDDDIELARLAELGRDVRAWKKIREGALHGWVKCSDGRLYHPVVAEKASEAFEKKRFYRERSKKANTKRWGGMDNEAQSAKPAGAGQGGEDAAGQDGEGQLLPSKKESLKDTSSNPPASQGTGTGTGTGNTPDKSGGGTAKRGARLPDDFVMPEDWKPYAREKGHSRAVVEREAEKFTLHWQAETGSRAAKRNWELAWKKWVLGIQPERGSGNQQHLGRGGGFTPISGPC